MSAALGAANATNPWLLGGEAALAGFQALSGLGKKKKANLQLDPFTFNPDPNDPEIALRRRAALLDAARTHANTVNEISRAGLLGSSASFGLMNQDQQQGDAALEDIPNSVYAKQRQNALDLYRDDAAFKRQSWLNDVNYGQQEHMAGLDALGSVGNFIGSSFNSSGDPMTAMKKRLLAGSDYLDYTNPTITRRL